MQLHISTPADELVASLERVSHRISDWADFHDQELASPKTILSKDVHRRLRDTYLEVAHDIDQALEAFGRAHPTVTLDVIRQEA